MDPELLYEEIREFLDNKNLPISDETDELIAQLARSIESTVNG